MKKIFLVLNLLVFASVCFAFGIKTSAAGRAFNISSKDYFLASLYKNVLLVNEDFRDIENPYYNPELYKYGLAISDVIYQNKTDYAGILKNRGIQYSTSTATDVAQIYDAKFQYQTSSLYPEGYTDDYERLKLVLKLRLNGEYIEWSSSTFYRYYTGSSLYGLPITYEAVKTFEYSLDNKTFYKIRMIDNRKLIIWETSDSTEKFEIDRTTHYNRNDQNPKNFPNPRLSKFDMVMKIGLFREDKDAYFHKIGEYDGDTSNVNNVKINSGAMEGYVFEVVYSGSQVGATIVTSPTVMGTYNFSEPVLGIAHRMMDIIPYLIWGNAENDNTTLKERFYFDYDEYSGGKNYTKRGNSLFNAISYGAYLSYDLNTLNDRVENPCVVDSLYY